MMEEHSNIVIGGGLLGCGIALELARTGKPVLLLERDAAIMNRASLRNEGKIHLGLIYAGDRSGRTGRRQLEGALSFRRIVSSWVGHEAFARIGMSTPFIYLAAKDSLFSAEQLSLHYEAIERHYRALADGVVPDIDYLGSKPDFLARRVDVGELPACLDGKRVAAAFETTERAIHTDQLAAEIRRTIHDHPLITLRCGTEVTDIAPQAGHFHLNATETSGAGPSRYSGKAVFNATWEQRLRLDGTLGIKPAAGWLHRLKYRVVVKLPAGLENGPSITIVLGRFGDVVIRPDHTAYLSWYPEGLQGWSHEIAPPASWDDACRGQQDPASGRKITSAIMRGLADWYPALADCEILSVDAGAIVARGQTDIDSAESGLHEREAGFTRHFGTYFSVDAGKLTTAPLVARQVVEAA